MAEREKILQDFDSGFTPKDLWEAHRKRFAELMGKSLDQIRLAIDQASWRRIEPAPGDFYEGTVSNWRFIAGRFNEDLYDGTAVRTDAASLSNERSSLIYRTPQNPVHIIRLPRDIARAAVEAAEIKLKE